MRPKIYKNGKNTMWYLDHEEVKRFREKFGKNAAPLVNQFIKQVNSGDTECKVIIIERKK